MAELPSVTKEQEHVLVTAGALLLALQTTERVMETCFTLILQLDGPVTVELLERRQQRKRTLGQLLTAMRQRIDIADEFDTALTEFLEKRNIFAHSLADVPGWSLDVDPGIVAANRFLGRLWQLNKIVLDVFCGLARAWSEENPGYPPFPKEFGAPYHLAIQQIFFAKSEPPEHR